MRHRRRPWLAVAFLIGFTSVALATVAQEAVLAALERDLELDRGARGRALFCAEASRWCSSTGGRSSPE